MAALDGRVPDNALLSHDLFEGLHARTALVTDVEVVDDYPSSVLAHARRQHRWTRGDWQILGWLFPYVPTRAGLRRNRLPLISRWKIFDNLRRSLRRARHGRRCSSPPGRCCPGQSAGLDRRALAALASRSTRVVARGAAGPRPQQPRRVFLRGLVEDARPRWRSVLLQLTFLANHAYAMAHAIVITLFRLVAHAAPPARVGDRGGAAHERAAARPGAPRLFLDRDGGEPAVALAALLLVLLVARPARSRSALPVLALWAAAPLIAHRLSQPIAARTRELGADDRQLLLERRAEDVALLRDVHGRRRTTGSRRTTSRRCPSRRWRTGPRRRTSAWGSSPRSPRTTSASSSAASSLGASTRPSRRSRAWSASRATSSTGTTR